MTASKMNQLKTSPRAVPDQEPYAGTDDVVLSDEEGVTYEAPVNPPAHPIAKIENALVPAARN